MKKNHQGELKRIVTIKGKNYLFPITTHLINTQFEPNKRWVQIGKEVYEFPQTPKKRIRKK